MNGIGPPPGGNNEPQWGGPPSDGGRGLPFDTVHGIPLFIWDEFIAVCEATGGRPIRLQFRMEPNLPSDAVGVVVVSTIGLRRGEQATVETRNRVYEREPARGSWWLVINGKRISQHDRAEPPSLDELGSMVARALNDGTRQRGPTSGQRHVHRAVGHRTTGRSNGRAPRRDGLGPGRT